MSYMLQKKRAWVRVIVLVCLGACTGDVQRNGGEQDDASAPGPSDATQVGTDSGRPPGMEASDGAPTLPPSEPGSALPLESLGERNPIPEDPAQYPKYLFADDLINETGELGLWIPPDVSRVRGILFYDDGVYGTLAPNPGDPPFRINAQQRRALAQRQLASLWDFAHLHGPLFRDGLDDAGKLALVERALEQYAKNSGHKELTAAPIIILGASRFSGFTSYLAEHWPERTIAYVPIVGSGGKSKVVPGLQVVGENDGGKEKLASGFYPGRGQGALLGAAMQWATGHVFQAEDLVWPFLDQLVRTRVVDARESGNNETSEGGPDPLVSYKQEDGFLADTDAWSGFAPFFEYAGDRARATWLPNRAVAYVWEAYVVKTPGAKIESPAQPYHWGGGFAQKASETRAEAPLDFVVSVSDATLAELELFDFDLRLGVLARDQSGKQATLKGVKLEKGMHSFSVRSAGRAVSRPAGIVLLP